MNRSEAKSCLAVCLLAAFFVFFSMQPSLAQDNSLSNAGETQATLITPSASRGELLYSDSFTARKESGWSVYSDGTSPDRIRMANTRSDLIAMIFPHGALPDRASAISWCRSTLAKLEDRMTTITGLSPDMPILGTSLCS